MSIRDRWETTEKVGSKTVRHRTPDWGKGDRWEVRYRDAAGVQRKKRFAAKDDAKDFEAELRMSPKIRATKTILSEMWEPWIAGKRRLKPKTIYTYTSAYNAHIQPELGQRYLSGLAASELSSWFGRIPSKDSARVSLVVLKGMLDLAVEDGMLATNPAANLKGGQTTRRKVPTLTAAKLDEFADAMQPFTVEFWLLAGCGLRFGEMAALKPSNVIRHKDGTSTLHIERTVQRIKGEMKWGSPKSGKDRDVPCPAWLTTLLPSTGDLVCHDPNGGVWLADGPWRAYWRTARDKVGLKGWHTHDLRHVFAARQIEAGTDLKTLQLVMGHAHLSITTDLYGDLARGKQSSVADIRNTTTATDTAGQETAA